MRAAEGRNVLAQLLLEAEAELAKVRAQRVELDRGERLASERVAHLRALVELESPSLPERPNEGDRDPAPTATVAAIPTRARGVTPISAGAFDRRPEDIAAEVLSEQGQLHYRSLWEEVARRGGVIVSGNPAAVLLTRISRDERFGKGRGRGVYGLVIGDEPKRPTTKRRRRKSRQRSKKKLGVAAE